MALHPTDRELVAAHLGGDRAALGSVYDRYGHALHDTAAAMLRDRDDAADVVQEVFLVAAQKLGQLRDFDRLKPWLFAILRNEVYLRTKQRRRSRPTDFSVTGGTDMAAPSDPFADGGGVEQADLAQLVRSAAGGLDQRDQLVMELVLRQDLSGDDLAAAVGVSASQAHVLVHRMRDRLLRSIGAFTVARMGRDDCDELSSILSGWDGTFSVLVRKRVARHVERCEVCTETRSKHAAGALFSAAPVLAAPADLRDVVLTAAARGMPPRNVHHLDGDGFPVPLGSPRAAGGARRRVAVVAVLLLLALLGGALYASTRDRGTPLATIEPSATSTTRATTSETTTTTSTTSTSMPSTTATTVPPTTRAPVITSPPATEPPERGPDIRDVRGPTSISCRASTRPFVRAMITDDRGVDSVELRWDGPGGPGATPMQPVGGDEWDGTLDPDRVDGSWTFTVLATDADGNTSSASQPFVVNGCSSRPTSGGGFANP